MNKKHNRNRKNQKIKRKSAGNNKGCRYNLSGGMSSWQQANLPVQSGAKAGGNAGADSQQSQGKEAKKKQRNISSSKDGDRGSNTDLAVTNNSLEDNSSSEKTIVYSAGYCPFTTKVKKLLDRKGVEFQQVNISNDSQMRTLVTGKAGQATLPQVFIGDTHIGNCDELYKLEKEGQLDSILGL